MRISKSSYKSLIFVFSLLIACIKASNIRSNQQDRGDSLGNLKQLLFPNRTFDPQSSSRRLQSDAVACTVCQGLTTCTILNGYQIQETYYPNNLNFLQTCKVIDELGSRLEPLIFGESRTFRDTPQCRGLF